MVHDVLNGSSIVNLKSPPKNHQKAVYRKKQAGFVHVQSFSRIKKQYNPDICRAYNKACCTRKTMLLCQAYEKYSCSIRIIDHKITEFFCTKINCICSHVHIYPENFRYLHFVSVFNLRIKQTGRKYIDYVKALTALTEDGILTRH